MIITKLDKYIIKKIVSTFFFSILSVLSITIVFDISEKMNDFVRAKLSYYELITGYYVGFAVFIGNMFFPLFTLLTVVMVTIKMNQRNEITAILSTGISFNRMLRPFMIGTGIIVAFSFFISFYLLAPANQIRLNFENNHTNYNSGLAKVNLEVNPGTVVSYNYYDVKLKEVVIGMWVDNFETDSSGKKVLVSTLKADNAYGDSASNKWSLKTVMERYYTSGGERLVRRASVDTTLSFGLKDIGQRTNVVAAMTYSELQEFRDKEASKGAKSVPFIEIEMYTRISNPLSLFIIALLGVCISIAPARSNVGLTILLGIGTVALYFVFNRFTTVAATNAGLNAFVAVWLPNVVLLLFTTYIYFKTPK